MNLIQIWGVPQCGNNTFYKSKMSWMTCIFAFFFRFYEHLYKYCFFFFFLS